MQTTPPGSAAGRFAVRAGGLDLKCPFLVGSGPTARTPEQLERAAAAGWAGASLKLAVHPAPYINREPRYRWLGDERLFLFTAEKRLTLDEGLDLMRRGRARVGRPFALLANVMYAGGDGLAGWAGMARAFEQAGADAIELNLCCPNMSFNLDASGVPCAGRPRSGASTGQDAEAVAAVVRAAAGAVRIPVWAKITPEGGRIGEVALAAVQAGASAVVSVANRLGLPPFDVTRPGRSFHRLQKELSLVCLSGGWIAPLALRDVYQIRRSVGPGPSVVGLGGVATWEEAVRMTMAGADAVGVCTETVVRGFGFLGGLMERLARYMDEMGYGSFREMRDLVVGAIRSADGLTLEGGHAVVDPGACRGCGRCLDLGVCRAIAIANGIARVDPALCSGCSTCADVCPSCAIAMAAVPQKY